jgi:hypothetical protein
MFLGFTAFAAIPAHAQTPDPPPAQADEDEGSLDLAEPDYVVVNVPTTLRLPVGGWDFHLTHRFDGNLRSGTFTDQLSNFFGVDAGATIGLEFRFGILPHLQAVALRTNRGRAIQFAAKYDAVHQNATRPLSVSGIVSIEGDNNFGANTGGAQKNYAPAVGLVLSRKVGTALALYATPFWVHNTGTNVTAEGNTGFIGLGARLRFRPTVYLIADVAPRLGGFVIGDPAYGFGIEKRVGGHVFALTFTNGTATITNRQLARGGEPQHLHFGFNLTRKFF